MKHSATAVLLVGGHSTRMGRDKALLPWGEGGTLIAAQHAALACLFEEVLLASGTAERYAMQGLCGIADASGVDGPMAGVIAGLAQARHNVVLTWPCDVPVTPEHLSALLAALEPAHTAAVIVGASDTQPLCAVYRRDAALSVLRAAASAGRFSVKAALAAMDTVSVHIAEALPNLNTPDEYRRHR